MTAKVKSVYEELNYTNADEMLIKARLVTEIADQVKRRRLTSRYGAGSVRGIHEIRAIST